MCRTPCRHHSRARRGQLSHRGSLASLATLSDLTVSPEGCLLKSGGGASGKRSDHCRLSRVCPGVPGLRLLVMGRGTQVGGSPCSDIRHLLVCVSDQLWEPGSSFEKPLATPGDGQSSGLCHRLPAGVRVQQPFGSRRQCESPLWISFRALASCRGGLAGASVFSALKALVTAQPVGLGTSLFLPSSSWGLDVLRW